MHQRSSRAAFVTPGTQFVWHDLAEWLKTAQLLNLRRASQSKYDAIAAHMAAVPVDLVSACDDPAVLQQAVTLWVRGPSGFSRPPRGQRATARHTALIVAAKNRLSQLDRAGDATAMSRGRSRPAAHGADGGLDRPVDWGTDTAGTGGRA